MPCFPLMSSRGTSAFPALSSEPPFAAILTTSIKDTEHRRTQFYLIATWNCYGKVVRAWRRYNDFRALDVKLRSRCEDLPRLPKRLILRQYIFGPHCVPGRLEGLQAYLQYIYPKFENDPDVMVFIGSIDKSLPLSVAPSCKLENDGNELSVSTTDDYQDDNFEVASVSHDPLPQVAPSYKGRVPVFVMLPLDVITDDGKMIRHESTLREWLAQLRTCGIRGVMVDVWWGLCEGNPREYIFDGYITLFRLLRTFCLQAQVVMSFHRCGGNVGDSAEIPIPSWALEVARSSGLLYQDVHGRVSEDCLSLAADNSAFFPSTGGTRRTALDCFSDFMGAFAQALAQEVDLLGTTVIDIQVGMGPCGELRYPSYMASKDWQYPGIGLIMAHDAGMRRMLAQAVEGCGLPPSYSSVPEGEPQDSNCEPDTTNLFRAVDVAGHAEEFRSGHGSFFLNWYRKVLLEHGDAVLRSAVAAFASDDLLDKLTFTVKIAGIHWHLMHPSRAAESCAGYTPATFKREGAYAATARMLAKIAEDTDSKISLAITCLEMTNTPNDAASAPEDLIAEVRQACLRHRIPLCGENALMFGLPESPQMLNQIVKQARGWSSGRDRMHSVTLLRLDHGFMRHASLQALRNFTSRI